MSHNHHLVGGPSLSVPFKPPRPFSTSPSNEETTTPHSSLVNVDSGNEVVRTEKRILWTQDEDVRLVSCLIQFVFQLLLYFSSNNLILLFIIDELLVVEFYGLIPRSK
jgi:hypothetical protein